MPEKMIENAKRFKEFANIFLKIANIFKKGKKFLKIAIKILKKNVSLHLEAMQTKSFKNLKKITSCIKIS